MLIHFSYYSAYRVGKDLGRDLEVILIAFARCLNGFLNDFGGHIGMMFLLLFILFQEECEAFVSILLRNPCQNECQIMRSLCQEECEADVSILLRTRCQSECEADVRMNAKPMSI